MELSQELTSTRTHLTLFLFSDCLEVKPLDRLLHGNSRLVSVQITKCRLHTWKTAAMKGSKSYKHLALIPLSDIRSLIEMSSFNLDGKSFDVK